MKYKSKRPPRVKQAEALKEIAGRDNFALLMEMRTGKTKVIIDDWAAGDVEDLLVIAPAGAYLPWAQALKDELPPGYDHTLYIWRSSKREATTDFLAARTRRVLLMNVEALSTIAAARELCERFLSQRRSMCVIDESVIIKTHDAKRTKFVVQRLGPLAAKRRILSGLPTPKSPLDLYCQFEFLDPNILNFENYYAFRARYAVLQKMRVGGRSIDIVVGYKNTEELNAKIAPHSFRVRLDECYDMPANDYSVCHVELTDEQRRVYAEMKSFATARLESGTHVTAHAVIAQMLRLHQVLCGHTTDENGQLQLIPELRTQALRGLLTGYEGKAVVWCSYDADVRRLSTAFPGEKIARFWGGNVATREAEEAMFKNDPECRIMIATAAAGGRGRTWDVADLVIYYSNTNNLDHRMQSEERAKNVGKARSVGYIDLLAAGTVEDKIIQALRAKIDMAAQITGDTWRQWLV